MPHISACVADGASSAHVRPKHPARVAHAPPRARRTRRGRHTGAVASRCLAAVCSSRFSHTTM
eukprot:5904893-Prymnesium_polylepis.1